MLTSVIIVLFKIAYLTDIITIYIYTYIYIYIYIYT